MATNAFEPKLELEFVIDSSPPDSETNCSAYPIANTDTSCKNALLTAFI